MSSSCCPESSPSNSPASKKRDVLFLGALLAVGLCLFAHLALPQHWLKPSWISFSASVADFLWQMKWGLLIAVISVGLLDAIPQELILRAFGSDTRGRTPSSLGPLMRATLAGVAFDLCNHGILAVGMKLYKKGVPLGQVMAFLIASPWNSFSLTFILFALIGVKLTLLFTALSLGVALLSGVVFEKLVQKKYLPPNPYKPETSTSSQETPTWGESLKSIPHTPLGVLQILSTGVRESKVVLKWLLLGTLLASLLRTSVEPELFAAYFGPSLLGLLFTTLAATMIEVCSEGSVPLAAELANTAKAPGGAFTFLMTGVSTDYTEILSLKETTSSWKVAFFLPLVTLPQILILGYLLNMYA